MFKLRDKKLDFMLSHCVLCDFCIFIILYGIICLCVANAAVHLNCWLILNYNSADSRKILRDESTQEDTMFKLIFLKIFCHEVRSFNTCANPNTLKLSCALWLAGQLAWHTEDFNYFRTRQNILYVIVCHIMVIFIKLNGNLASL